MSIESKAASPHRKWLIVLPIWLAALIGMSIYNARHPRQRVQLPSTHIVYKHTSIRDLDVIRRCLLEKPSTTLNLRQHLGRPRSRFPVARLDNPVRAIVVDIYDTGNRRVLFGYSRNGEPLFDRETAALDRCAA